MKKATNGFEKNMQDGAMKRWKEHVHASRQAKLKDEINELQRRKEHNDASINGLVNEIETAEGQNFHLKSKLNKQG